MGGINLGIAAGAFAQASDIKDWYSNFTKMRTALQVRQLQKIQPGDIIGSAPPKTVVGPDGKPVTINPQGDPRQVLMSAGFTGSQLNQLLGSSPDKINAALDNVKGNNPASSYQFYKDPTTGQLSATNMPLKADQFYVQSHIAQIYQTSGDPDLVAKGFQMAADVQTQQNQALQMKTLQRQQDIQAVTLQLQKDPAQGVKMLNDVFNKDFSDGSNFGTTTQFNYDPKTNSVTQQDFDGRGKPVGSPSPPMAIQDSQDGRTQGLISFVMGASDPQTYTQLKAQQVNAVYQSMHEQNENIEAHAAVMQAGAAGESAQADVMRANNEALLIPGQLAAQKSEVAKNDAQAAIFGQVASTDQAAAQTNQAISKATSVATDPNSPFVDRINAIRQLTVANKLPQSMNPMSPVPGHPDEMFVHDINGIPAAIQKSDGSLTPIGSYAKAAQSPQGVAAGVKVGLLPGGFAAIQDNYGHFGTTGDPMQDMSLLYNSGVKAGVYKPAAAPSPATNLATSDPMFGGGMPRPSGLNATVPSAGPMLTAPQPQTLVSPQNQPTFAPAPRAGGTPMGLSAGATSGQAGIATPGTAQFYGPQGPGGFGATTGISSGLAGGVPVQNPSIYGDPNAGNSNPVNGMVPYMLMQN